MSANISEAEVPKGIYGAMMQVEKYINNLGLDKRALEIMRFRVAQLNGCAYCIDMHYKDAIAIGEDPKRLYSVSAWRDTPYYSEKERALLEWADAVTLISENEIGTELMQEMLKHFTKEEIANWTLAIAQINSWTRLGKSFGFEPGNYQPGNHE